MQDSNAGDAPSGLAWPPRRIVASVNPATHRPAEPIVAQLRANVPAGVDLDVRLTDRAGVTGETALAALPEADLIVAVGGHPGRLHQHHVAGIAYPDQPRRCHRPRLWTPAESFSGHGPLPGE